MKEQTARSVIAQVPDHWAVFADDGHVGLIGEANADSILAALARGGFVVVRGQRLGETELPAVQAVGIDDPRDGTKV